MTIAYVGKESREAVYINAANVNYLVVFIRTCSAEKCTST